MTQDIDVRPKHDEDGHVHYILIQLEENPLNPEEATFNVSIENLPKDAVVNILRDLADQIEVEAEAEVQEAEAEIEDLAVAIPSLEESQ